MLQFVFLRQTVKFLLCVLHIFSQIPPHVKIKPTALNGQLRFFNLLMASFFVENVLVKTDKYAQHTNTK